MKSIIVTLCVCCLAVAATRVYDVDLSGNDNGFTGKSPQPNWVGQTFVATADSILWLEFMEGRPLNTGDYVLRIYDSLGNQARPGVAQAICHLDSGYRFRRAKFSSPVFVLKGVKYMLKIWHSDTFAVNFYFNRSDPYKYGRMILPSGMDTIIDADLAARVEGTNALAAPFAAQSCMPILRYDYFWDGLNYHRCAERHADLGIQCDKIGMGIWGKLQDAASVPPSLWHWEWLDTIVVNEAKNGIQNYWQLNTTTNWARSTKKWCTSLPLNLFEPVLDSNGNINSANYWGNFVYHLYKRYGASGTFWDSFQVHLCLSS